MKKFLVFCIICTLALTGCGDKEEETVPTNNTTESQQEQPVKPKSYTYKNEKNEEVVSGNEWPDGLIIPKPTEGTIKKVITSGKDVIITVRIENLEKAKNYIQALKDAGFNKNVSEESKKQEVVTYGQYKTGQKLDEDANYIVEKKDVVLFSADYKDDSQKYDVSISATGNEMAITLSFNSKADIEAAINGKGKDDIVSGDQKQVDYNQDEKVNEMLDEAFN